MKEILFLPHRLPYPPDKGDKIRSYHILKYLAEHYRVHLGTFVDDTQDWKYRDQVSSLCDQTKFVRLRPWLQRLKSTKALASGEALTLRYYESKLLRHWLSELTRTRNISAVLSFSSCMNQYLDVPGLRQVPAVLDYVDVDSEKWTQYSLSKQWPMSKLYAREGRTLALVEAQVSGNVRAITFVSKEEADLFRVRNNDLAKLIFDIPNGVDTDFFDPDVNRKSPYPDGCLPIVFTGAMDYWANIDAVKWFVSEIWPGVRENLDGAHFYIVGARPSPSVKALSKTSGVHVTGRVEDIRPFLAHAVVAVAPMRIARGVQNKVLEALAMARPVVATNAAAEGIAGADGCSIIADSELEFAKAIIDVALSEESENAAGRCLVQQRYSWDFHLANMLGLLVSGKKEEHMELADAITGDPPESATACKTPGART